MDNPTIKEVIAQEKIYNGRIVVTIRDKVVVDMNINKDIYRRKKK